MKKEELFEALQNIDDEKVISARDGKVKKKPIWIRWAALAACAALVIGTFAGVRFFKGRAGIGPETYPGGIVAVTAQYPAPTAVNLTPQKFMESDEHWEWFQAHREETAAASLLRGGMTQYYSDLMQLMLVSEDENTVCSPLNVYIAFAMLAEVTDGDSRQQILDMLGAPDIASLRKDVKALWEGNYADTPMLKSILANSIWLRDGVEYNTDTMSRLASQYYASSFSGVPGSEAMDEALRSWTDRNTNGLLTEYVKDMKLDPSTVMSIVSTIYYKAQWVNKFPENSTTQETFHGTLSDTAVDMMHMTSMMRVYNADQFTAVELGLTDSGSMFFYLPKDGVDVNALAEDPEVLTAADPEMNGNSWSFPLVNLSLPKFSVSEKSDLLETIKKLGITDVLDPGLSDFSPLTDDFDELYLSTANHAAMVEIDENGVTAAAYTELALTEGAALPEDEIDLVFDRPFMFVVTGQDGSVLFSGIVRNIAE
ncbi:MAG: serpin family protein [Oscillospiraceae bacterium]|nr:serpin family protein [Oscillospiraceae bacterium]